MDFSISESVRKRFPGIKVGFAFIKSINVKKDDILLEELKSSLIFDIQTNNSTESLSQNPKISTWRDYFNKMGIDPSKYKPAHESLIRRIIKNKAIPKISTLVDCANVIAARYQTPVGVFDLDKINDYIQLRISKKGELFLPLFESHSIEVTEGEVVYADSNKIFSKYNIDSDYTKTSLNTRNAFVVVDGIGIYNNEQIMNGIKEAADLIIKFNGGRVISLGVLE